MPNQHQWDFVPPELPAPGPRPPIPAQSFKEFLGFGITAPFRRDKKQDFAAAGGEPLIRSCVAQVLGTQCSDAGGTLQGELPWRHAFGSMLYRLKHKKGIVLQELARIYVIDALRRWEPRVVITFTNIKFDRQRLLCTITIRYHVITQNVAGNQVLLRDIEQQIDMPLAA
jgi:phage baseplate assembly protein W